MADHLPGEADELQIRNIIARLAHSADRASEEELEAAYFDHFTDDAVWEVSPEVHGNSKPAAVRRGRDDIRAGVMARRLAGRQGPGTDTLHVVTTMAVRLDGDTASAESCFMFLTEVSAHPCIAIAGLYEDEFRRNEAVWRLARRLITRP